MALCTYLKCCWCGNWMVERAGVGKMREWSRGYDALGKDQSHSVRVRFILWIGNKIKLKRQVWVSSKVSFWCHVREFTLVIKLEAYKKYFLRITLELDIREINVIRVMNALQEKAGKSVHKNTKFFLKLALGGGSWAAQSIKRQTLDFSSGHDLRVCEFEHRIRLCADSMEPAWDPLSLPLRSSPACVLSKRNKLKQ